MRTTAITIFLSLWALFEIAPVHAESARYFQAHDHVHDRYAQILLGSHRVDQSWYLNEDQGQIEQADIRSIHTLGYFAQLPVAPGRLQYGAEFGGHLGYDSRRNLLVVISGDGSRINIQSRLWAGDLSAGVFLSARPVDGLRFYAGAGPLIYWGQLRRYDDSASESQGGPTPSGAIVIDTRRNRYDLGVAFYGRVGVELMPVPGFTVGLSARRTTTELDFGQSGFVDLGRVNYMLTLGGTF